MKYLQNWGVAFLAGCTLLLSACSIQMDDEEKLRDIEFTVVDQREIPEELGARIEKEKAEAFRYNRRRKTGRGRGYGRKDTGGYSVEVTECYESTNAVCLRTRLRGPSRDEEITEEATWPYIVVKMEYCDKHVIFQ